MIKIAILGGKENLANSFESLIDPQVSTAHSGETPAKVSSGIQPHLDKPSRVLGRAVPHI